MKLSFAASFLLGCTGVPAVYGWGAAGHEIVATIAQIHLHPSVLPTMCNILNFTSTNPNEPQCHLAPISTWADRLKYRMRWSAPLHYVGAVDDYPSETCAFPGDHGWAGKKSINILGGIRNTTNLLENWMANASSGKDIASQDDVANEALKFLVHFMGDLHMPLHLTGRDRGGNSVKVLFDSRQTNLHSLWDGLLIAKTLRSVPQKYNNPLPIEGIEHNLRGTIYDSWVRQIMWEGVLNSWKDDIPNWLACPAQNSASVESSVMTSSSPSLFSSAWTNILKLSTYLISAISSGPESVDDDVLCPQHWAEPIHAMNCEFIWPKALDEPPYVHSRFDTSNCDGNEQAHDHSCGTAEDELLSVLDANGRFTGGEAVDSASASNPKPHVPYLELDTAEYAGIISERKILEKLMAQGGIRLAGVLNWLFADVGEGGDEQLRSDVRQRVLSVVTNF